MYAEARGVAGMGEEREPRGGVEPREGGMGAVWDWECKERWEGFLFTCREGWDAGMGGGCRERGGGGFEPREEEGRAVLFEAVEAELEAE